MRTVSTSLSPTLSLTQRFRGGNVDSTLHENVQCFGRYFFLVDSHACFESHARDLDMCSRGQYVTSCERVQYRFLRKWL